MKQIALTLSFGLSLISVRAQNLSLTTILSKIQESNPAIKMFDAEIRSSDAIAKGARSWEAPELSSGFWMTPYNPSLWKKNANGSPGMGQYMITATQMFPSKKELDANENYLLAVSSVNKNSKEATLNELYAAAKKYYFDWMISQKKIKVLDENEKLLDFMIRSSELRYKNNLGKLPVYYKAKAALGNIENLRLEIENEIRQQRSMLNTLMNRSKDIDFSIDSSYFIKVFVKRDSAYFSGRRSDIMAIDKTISLTYLQQGLERTKLKPKFGASYWHMFGFGGLPEQFSLMATVKFPIASWSSRSYKANIESLQYKAESYDQQKQILLNEISGEQEKIMADIESKKKQLILYQNNIIPALQNNYKTSQLAYEQNTEELFTLFDAWQTLNMTQLEYLQQVQELLIMQVELEKIQEIK